MKVIRGDLIHYTTTGRINVLIHGCNCFCVMGAGIARQIKATFPEAFEADRRTVPGDKEKLGTFSSASFARNNHRITIVNAYTQYKYGRGGVYVDYGAVDEVFKAIRDEFHGKNLKLGYPKIGCGLAGGDWNIVGALIDKNLEGMDHTLVIK